MLAVVIFYTYVKIFQDPYLGFRYSRTGELVEFYVENTSLQLGDLIEQIGSVTWAEFEADHLQPWPDIQQRGSVLQMRVIRDGEEIEISWILPGVTREELAERLNSEWWLTFVFWLAGTATLFLVRPRDTAWRLLIAFNYLTAIWLAAGGVSRSHLSASVVVFIAAVWISFPVYLHLHWVFPRSLGKIPIFITGLIYIAAIVIAVAESIQLLPRATYQAGFVIAVVGSLILLLFRFIRHPSQRREVGILGAAIFIAFVPLLAVVLLTVFDIEPAAIFLGGFLLALPAIPGAYFYTIYRRQLGSLEKRADHLAGLYAASILIATVFLISFSILFMRTDLLESTIIGGVVATLIATMLVIVAFAPFLFLPALSGAFRSEPSVGPASLEFRANRLITPYLFVILLGAAITVFVIFAVAWFGFSGTLVIISLLAVVFAGVIFFTGYEPFKRFVDHRLLGITLPPENLLETYAGRITTSSDRPKLKTLITNEVLPSLSVRQSLVLILNEREDVTVFVNLGVASRELPTAEHSSLLISQIAGNNFAFPATASSGRYSWIHLALLLEYGGKPIGLWLFGRRDPDDLYARSELPLLQALAGQTAVALVNIIQRENLRSLYRRDIERHEVERADLARSLHDEVLNQIAVLSMYIDDAETHPQFQEAFSSLTSHLRQTIAGLRPAMLNYGLRAAFDELVDELDERANNNEGVTLDMPAADVRYPEKVEQHIFRIIQQAAENALKHSQAQTISIGGRLDPGRIELFVQDNGVGFSAGESLDLTEILARKHFGLAGMFERAALIRAELKIDSKPGSGTEVCISWNEKDQQSTLI